MKTQRNKTIIARNFSHAAHQYEHYRNVQKTAAQQLCQLAKPFIANDQRIIDLGCGTVNLGQYLDAAPITGLDLSLSMLNHNDYAHSICGDIEHLPLKHASCDVIISSFALQWIDDFDRLFQALHPILKDNGILVLCLPVDDSLRELKQMSADLSCPFYFNKFPTINAIEQSLYQAHFIKKHLSHHTLTTHHDNALAAIKSIKAIGARYSDNQQVIKKSAFTDFIKSDANFDLSWDVAYMIFQKC